MAFEIDWQPIKWGYTSKDFTDSEKNEIFHIIHNKYSVICNIFTHYCGPAKGVFFIFLFNYIFYLIYINLFFNLINFNFLLVGERFGLSLVEFKHLAHFGRIVSCLSSNEIIGKII
jgi:hypothetical protein